MDSTATPVPSRRRPLRKSVMHALRRGHLYCGLLMLPFVILYGITAFLFNHPGAFPDRQFITFGSDEVAGTPMEGLPTPVDVATQVVTAINANGKTSYQLVEPEAVRYERDSSTATVKTSDGKTYNVTIDVDGGGGMVRPKVEAPPPAKDAPFAVRNGVVIESSPTKGIEAALPSVMSKIGLSEPTITDVRLAPLTFLMEGDGQRWRVTYNASFGSVSGRPADETNSNELSTRRFLTRLHLTHGYPGEVNSRWIYAIIVDAMAFIMVFWGITGILMWWQIKATRRLGMVVLLASIGIALWVGIAMHQTISSAPTPQAQAPSPQPLSKGEPGHGGSKKGR